jgi:ArsR family transcriptional regulator, cadmium/lead-responsive transcriptional repressor
MSLYTNRCTVCAVAAAGAVAVDDLARVGHALSDATRSQILLALQAAPGYPSELAAELGVSRQSMSNHLACLRGCGLVVAVPEGRRVRYELADPRLGQALADLRGLVLVSRPSKCGAADDEGCC